MAIFWNTHGRITPEVAQAHIVELLSLSPPVTLPSPFSPASPPPPTTAPERAPLDTPDELALRALLLGIAHRAAGLPTEARRFLRDAHARHARIPSTGSTWIGGVALFELAVLELRDAQRLEQPQEGETEAEGTTASSSSASSSSSEEGGAARVAAYGARSAAAGRNGETLRHLRVDPLRQLGGDVRARWNRVLKDAGALLDSAMSLSGSEVDLSSRLESRIAMLRDEIALKREMLGGP